MSRVTLEIRMKLLSDVIFDAGVGVPGGEQVAVVRDEEGYPYLESPSLKSALWESVRNVLAWHGKTEENSAEMLDALFGRKNRAVDHDRGLQFTPLKLLDPPEDAASCFTSRFFIALEDGRAKRGQVKTSMAICKGLEFRGTVRCSDEDVSLVREAVSATKWMGRMTWQGMGYVQMTSRELPGTVQEAAFLPAGCRCIRYVLHTETPVQIRNLRESSSWYKETGKLIPGSAVRGMVMERLSEENPAWFAENRQTLLSDSVRFLNALPNPGGLPAVPSLLGFYEDKGESCLEKVVVEGSFSPGHKRARLGSFCALQGHALQHWEAACGGLTKWEQGRSCFNRYLREGQDFEGYVLLEEPSLAPEIAAAFGREIWIGANRHGGFGLCSVKEVTPMEAPLWTTAYGYGPGDKPGEHLYLAALSSLTMLNDWGEPCGLRQETLAEKLGVTSVEILHCSTGVEETGGYNRTRGCGRPILCMYRPGSLFHLKCDRAPALERILAVQREGLGVRRAEGCGQVLFLRPELYESLQTKQELCRDPSESRKTAAALRRAKYTWAIENAPRMMAIRLNAKACQRLRGRCERAVAENDDGTLIRSYLDKLIEIGNRDRKYREVKALFEQVLNTPLEQLLGFPCRDDPRTKQELLLLMLDVSRKEGAE